METLVKPEWIKARYRSNSTIAGIAEDLKKKGLATVCQEALCPNISECWGGGTATFMLMGDTCTRGCRFCYVRTSARPAAINPYEHRSLLSSIQRMNLSYVVLTSVDRDELPDQGAGHLAKCIAHLKENIPSLRIEILIPDFRGERALLREIVKAKPDVIAHNIETVERLTPTVRDRRATYRQSLSVLAAVREMDRGIYTKSSIMVGLGETEEEVARTMDELREAGASFLTIGQYLRPSPRQLAVRSYIEPRQFRRYEELGRKKGFLYVASGPLVRSSYKAGELFDRSVRSEKN